MKVKDVQSIGDADCIARLRVLEEPGAMDELVDRDLLPERGYCAVERRLPEGWASLRQSVPADPDARLTPGASLMVILLSSLGLWAVIWALVALFPSPELH